MIKDWIIKLNGNNLAIMPVELNFSLFASRSCLIKLTQITNLVVIYIIRTFEKLGQFLIILILAHY